MPEFDVQELLKRKEIVIGLAIGGVAGLFVLLRKPAGNAAQNAAPGGASAALHSSVEDLYGELQKEKANAANNQATILDQLAGFFAQQADAFQQTATQITGSVDQSNEALSSQFTVGLDTLGQSVNTGLTAVQTGLTNDIVSNIASAVTAINSNTASALRRQTARETAARTKAEEAAAKAAERAAKQAARAAHQAAVAARTAASNTVSTAVQ